jgi:hypothetical protein
VPVSIPFLIKGPPGLLDTFVCLLQSTQKFVVRQSSAGHERILGTRASAKGDGSERQKVFSEHWRYYGNGDSALIYLILCFMLSDKNKSLFGQRVL